jgi:inhibitor of cysteine peptidase
MILVKKSEPVFTIILQSNPTTGYSWSLKNYDPNIILPLSRKFYPSTSKGLVGAPGYEKWTFRVKAGGFTVPQLTSITLIYLRPWEEQGVQTINFKVVTNNAN